MIDTNNPTMETPLHFAVSRDNFEIVKLLIKAIRDVIHSHHDQEIDKNRSIGGLSSFHLD